MKEYINIDTTPKRPEYFDVCSALFTHRLLFVTVELHGKKMTMLI